MTSGSTLDAIRVAITGQLPDATVEVSGQGGHFNIAVTSKAFAGKRTLERHQLVLMAIKDLMAGDNAPVHAVDTLATRIPE